MEEWVGSLEELLEGRQQTVEEARRFTIISIINIITITITITIIIITVTIIIIIIIIIIIGCRRWRRP